MRTRPGLLCLAFVAAGLLGCQRAAQDAPLDVPGAPSAGLPAGGTVVVGLVADPGDLNPLFSTAEPVHWVAVNWANKLVRFAPDYTVIPDLAADWQISADGLVYTFTLASGITWQDGQPLTAEDVQAGLDVVRKQGARAAAFETIAAVETAGPQAVVIRLLQPDAALLHNLAWGSSFILRADEPGQLPIGTGPFRLVEYVRNDHITLAANPAYFRGRPHLDRLIFKILPDPQAAQLAFEAGEVDGLYNIIGVTQVRQLTGRATILVKPTPNLARLVFNLKAPFFQDVRVRRAVAQALDRRAIAAVALQGEVTPVANASPIPSALAWAYPADAADYPYDPAAAERLLDEAGFPRGADGQRFTTRLVYAATGTWPDVMQMLQVQLAQVGIQVKLEPVDITTYSDIVVTRHDFDLANGSGTLSDPDLLRNLYGCAGTFNIAQYCQPEVEQLLAAGRQHAAPAERAELYRAAARLIAADLPSVPLWMIVRETVWRPGIGGGTGEPLFFFDLAGLYREQ